MEKTSLRVLQYLQAFACSCILIFSCGLIASAIILKDTVSKYSAFLYYYGTVMTSYIIGGSVLSIIIAIWGCYSSYKKRPTPLFTTVVSLNLIAHITFSVLYLSFLEERLSDSVGILFDEQIQTYIENPQPMDNAQINLKCCGKYQAMDWFNYLPYIPASCCPDKLNNETIGCAFLDFFVVNHNGCIKELENFTDDNVDLITAWFLGLQISEISLLAITSWYSWQLLMGKFADKEQKQQLHTEEKRKSHSEEITHL